MKAFMGAIALAMAGCAAHSTPSQPIEVSTEQLAAQVDGLETASGGRLGLALFSQDHGLVFAHRGEERFAMCSTFKLALAAMALDTPGVRNERLDFGADDVLSYAPYAKERAQIGWMSGMEAAHHAVTLSDNTAANLLLARLGGPEAFTAWLRDFGDRVTRLDRNEPTLNENAPGDARDTTTPGAKAELVGNLLWGERLSASDRLILRDWLVETPTGAARLRAGLPDNWNAGDKTGTCGGEEQPEFNDIAVFETPAGSRYVLAAFLDRPTGTSAEAEAVLANAARAVADWIRKSGA